MYCLLMLVNMPGPVYLLKRRHNIDGKEKKIIDPISYQSRLFKVSQLNWTCLTKEAYAKNMSIKKPNYYLEDADITLRSDHLP